jgi:hypothetical protein
VREDSGRHDLMRMELIPLHAKQRVRKVLVVERVDQLAARLVLERPHLAQTVVGLLGRQIGGDFVARDIRPLAVLRQRLERVDHVTHRRDVVRLLADHERHVVLQGHEAVAVGVDHVQNALEWNVSLALLDQRQIVAESPQTRLELVMVQTPGLLTIEMLEHHRELAERLFTHARLITSLDLLLQIMDHPHAQLIQLVPGLCQAKRCVLSVFVVQNESLLESGA